MDYQIEELIRDTLVDDAILQGYVGMRVYTDHISDIVKTKESFDSEDLEFPCITMTFFGGRWRGEHDNDVSFDRVEIEISSNNNVAPKTPSTNTGNVIIFM